MFHFEKEKFYNKEFRRINFEIRPFSVYYIKTTEKGLRFQNGAIHANFILAKNYR
jgi:hypothetical protein